MRTMRSWVMVCAALVIMLGARPVLAASDMTGKWTTEMKTPDGSTFPLTFDFKQDGAKLTGTVTGPQGDPLAIDNGKVDGDKFSFTVSINGMTINHEGTIDGDQIRMTTKTDSADFPGSTMTLKRSKATQ